MSVSLSRYALYYAPEQNSLPAELGARLLGRNAWTGTILEQPELPGIDPVRLAELTEEPRHYGLHATLKPPFFLAEGISENDLERAVLRLAASHTSFTLPRLEIRSIGRFLALALIADSPALENLARHCVMDLDGLRRPSTDSDLARRRSKGLTEKQDQLLLRYGYPYVLEEFRFHLTLTGSMERVAERELLRERLHDFLSPALTQPLTLRELCIFRQPTLTEPFTVWRKVDLMS